MLWRHFGASLIRVPSIQVKDVPDDVHATLRRRAAEAGQSLQEYLLARLIEDAHTPTLEEILQRAGGRAGGRAGYKAAAKAVRAERDTR
jgi:plasmid stability protein